MAMTVPPKPPTVWEQEADTLRLRLREDAVVSERARALRNAAQVAVGARVPGRAAIGAAIRSGIKWVIKTTLTAIPMWMLERFSCVLVLKLQQVLRRPAAGFLTTAFKLVVKFVVYDLVVYGYDMYRGTADATAAPWLSHNLLERILTAASIVAINASVTCFCRAGWGAIEDFETALFGLEMDMTRRNAQIHNLCQRIRVRGGVLKALEGLLQPLCSYEWEYPVGVQVAVPADLRCTITCELFLEPVMLGGDVFEKKELEEWIIRTGRHPVLNDVPASLAQIKPCPQMRDLVTRFAEGHGIRKVRVAVPPERAEGTAS